MQKEPYYQGDTVDLEFHVKENLKPTNPQSATVSIYWGEKQIVFNQGAKVEKDLVSYSTNETKESGDYMAVFTVYFSPEVKRTHKILFRILSKAPIKGEDEVLLDEKSSPYEIRGAMAKALRSLRRSEVEVTKATKMVSDIVAKKTKKRQRVEIYTGGKK
jgi:hypothetical protein